jgi:hypothetical protein
MAILPHTILKALRSSYAHLHAPVAAAEAALAQAERTLSAAQRACVDATKILVFDQGEIVAAGTHHELLHREGAYRRAALLQMVDDESRALLVEETGQVEAAL